MATRKSNTTAVSTRDAKMKEFREAVAAQKPMTTPLAPAPAPSVAHPEQLTGKPKRTRRTKVINVTPDTTGSELYDAGVALVTTKVEQLAGELMSKALNVSGFVQLKESAEIVKAGNSAIDVLRTQAIDISTRTKSLTISDPHTLDIVTAELHSIVDLRKKIVEYHKPLKEAAYREHQSRCEQEAADLQSVAEAERYLKSQVSIWQTEQQRLQAIKVEQARLADEQRRQSELAQAKREAQEKTDREIERLMIEEDLSLDEAVERVNPTKQIALAQESVPIARTVTPAVATPKGISLPVRYSVEVVDIVELCRAVADGKVSSEYVLANHTAMNRVATVEKETFNIPGVKLVKTQGVNVR